MLNDDEIPIEYGELGHRIVELHLEREMRILVAILIVCGIVLVVLLLVLAILLSPSLR